MYNKLIGIICAFFSLYQIDAQENLILGGGFQSNANIFLRDSQIGAANIPQYDHQIFGGEAWLNLNASYAGFNGGIRFDLFNNSNLLNPQGSYTDQGIGQWYITKSVNKLDLSAGHIYDQIGTGIIYRAYEERTQLIDNALIGVAAKMNFTPDWNLRGFFGKQRNLFSSYRSSIKGLAFNGFYQPKGDSVNWSISPGAGFINRTLSSEMAEELLGIVAGYEPVDQFIPFYNTNAFTVFNTLNYKNLSWYIETAFKPKDIYFDPTAIRSLPRGNSTLGKLVSKEGYVFYSSLSGTIQSLGFTLEAKKTLGMDFRAEPLLSLNKGLINFIPPMARINTYRLNALYYPATQFLSEMAYQVDLKYALGDHWNFGVNYSDIRDHSFKNQLYNEIYGEIIYKKDDSWQLTAGVQHQLYNIAVYYGETGEENVNTITPFAELLYKFNRKTSIRVESQYMNNKTDIGSWVNGVVEIGYAPHFLFEISDMYNTQPTKGKKALHYPALGIVYTDGPTRFGVRYVKQIEGIVCSGGICRLEPAFSGIRASINTTF